MSGPASLSGEAEQQHNILLPLAVTTRAFDTGGGAVLGTEGLVRTLGGTLLGSLSSNLGFLETSDLIFSVISSGRLTGSCDAAVACCDCLGEIVMLSFSWFGLNDFYTLYLI